MFFSRIAGHRGWPTRFPDNTAAGITEALAAVGSVETDVRRTLDGVLVLSHDPVMAGLLVCETPWNDLRALDLGQGHAPLSVGELLSGIAGNHPIDLEVKNSPGEPGFEPDHLIALETAAAARTQDLVSCFYWPSMDAVRVEFPNVATGLLLDDPVPGDDAIEHARALGHVAIIPSWRMILRDPGLVARARAEGLEVITWTVDDPAIARRLFSSGVATIITNEPGGMKTALSEGSK